MLSGGETMFRIGEFSRLTQVSVRMLRYYDETGLLAPAEVDPWTGHRLYSAEQIPRLNKILYLRDSGLNVSEIALALTADERSLLAQLIGKRAEIERAIRTEEEKLRKIELAEREIRGGRGELRYSVSVKPVPAYPVLSVRKTVPGYDSEGELWQELSAFAGARKIELTGEPFSIYHDPEFRETDVDIELCAPVRRLGTAAAPFRFRTTEPVPYMACTMVYGDFANIRGAYLAFADWLQKNSAYKLSDPMRQIVHRGPWNESRPENYLTELQIPLERTEAYRP